MSAAPQPTNDVDEVLGEPLAALRRSAAFRAVQSWGFWRRVATVFVLGLVVDRLSAGLGFIIPALAPATDIADELPRYGWVAQIVLVVLVSPLAETLLTQALPIGLLSSVFKVDARVSILISACSFGLLHASLGIGYVLQTFVAGLIFGVAYASYMPGARMPIALVAVSHALNNAFFLWLNALK